VPLFNGEHLMMKLHEALLAMALVALSHSMLYAQATEVPHPPACTIMHNISDGLFWVYNKGGWVKFSTQASAQDYINNNCSPGS
jgi:hypothetical protein